MAGFERGGEGGKKEGVYWEEKDSKSFLFPRVQRKSFLQLAIRES